MTNKELEKKVNELEEKMVLLETSVANLVASQEVKKEPQKDVPSPFTPPNPGAAPVPTEFEAVINETLNKAFGREIVYRPDGQFELTIKVPREYSNAGQNHWDMYKEDSRMKVILNVLGVIGVREYVTQIADNLGQEIRAKINEDRIKLA